MQTAYPSNKRVVVVYWKARQENPFEVFSSLKNFCLSYQEYNYNTLSNYLSMEKTAYEDSVVRVERKDVYAAPKANADFKRKIAPVVHRVSLEEADDYTRDVDFWLTKTPIERLSAVTFIVRQSLSKGQVLDKSQVIRRNLK